MKQRHGWNERGEDRIKREFVANKFGGSWRLQSKAEGEEEWTQHDPPTREQLETLRDILFRKYQRRRASYEDVQSIEKWLEALP